MLNRIASAAMVAAISLSATQAGAGCLGGPTFYTCTDSNGNSYTVNKLGNTTNVFGSNSQDGTTWNQSSTDLGFQTVTRGSASNGQSWNMTQSTLGGGYYTQQGTDADGNSFAYTCNQFGCQ